jgi:hypothetical protein
MLAVSFIALSEFSRIGAPSSFYSIDLRRHKFSLQADYYLVGHVTGKSETVVA